MSALRTYPFLDDSDPAIFPRPSDNMSGCGTPHPQDQRGRRGGGMLIILGLWVARKGLVMQVDG